MIEVEWHASRCVVAKRSDRVDDDLSGPKSLNDSLESRSVTEWDDEADDDDDHDARREDPNSLEKYFIQPVVSVEELSWNAASDRQIYWSIDYEAIESSEILNTEYFNL